LFRSLRGAGRDKRRVRQEEKTTYSGGDGETLSLLLRSTSLFPFYEATISPTSFSTLEGAQQRHEQSSPDHSSAKRHKRFQPRKILRIELPMV
jgi:hypothetical protein